MKITLADVKSILDITEGSSWNLKTELEKSFHLIHKEADEGRLEIGADTKYLQKPSNIYAVGTSEPERVGTHKEIMPGILRDLMQS